MNTPAFPPFSEPDTELRQRAERAGIATAYTGFWGDSVRVGADVLTQALHAMGRHTDTSAVPEAVVACAGQAQQLQLPVAGPWQLHNIDVPDSAPCASGDGAAAELPATLEPGYYRLCAPDGVRTVLVAPAQCWLPEGLTQGERWWGLTTQMYALRSERSWGIGDFSDLARCATIAAAQGAAFVGVSPLHALRPGQPEAASPYSPSSRVALNVLHIDVTGVPEYLHCQATQSLVAGPAFQAQLQAVQQSTTVDYTAVAALKEAALTLIW